MRISIMSSRELFISSPRCTCAGATVRDATFDVITSNLMFSEIFLMLDVYATNLMLITIFILQAIVSLFFTIFRR